MASPSSSRCAYDVFLSFRGADTRKAFTDHLYTNLLRVGIPTFRDDDAIVRGEDIEDQIRKGIESSKSAVIVFSRDYASSSWCLDELFMIMDRRRTNGFIVIPVFYDVDPDEVSEQSGGYGQAFAAHVKQFPAERVSRWRGALRDATNLAGMVLQNRHEAPFIEDIVREVNERLNRKVLYVPPYLVPVDSHVEKIGSWLRAESSNVKIVVIYGIGGVGKTTIAKILYNQHYTSFEGSSFLADINRETLKQSDCVPSLQRQLLSDIQRVKSEKIRNVHEGIVKISNAVRCKRVLIVLDDVNQLEQFNNILGMQRLKPGSGSKMIVTTRDASLLNALEGCKGVEIPPLDDCESLVLFSMHTFRRYPPAKRYMEQSNTVVKYCGGLPLALECLGSYFGSKRDVHVWKSALREIQEVSHPKIQETLRMSYDSLLFYGRKDLFLDIACFFDGMEKHYVATIAEGCGYYSKVGIQDLIDKCLINIDGRNRLMMHPLIRDMGRRIVHEESRSDPGKRSRLWNNNDAIEVLSQHSGTESIQGLSLNLLASKQAMSNAPQNSSLVKSFRAEDFANMKRLKLLQLSNVNLYGDYKNLPKRLVWLNWGGCCLDRVPSDLCLENLVVLEMSNSSLKSLWNGTRLLPKLKILNLSHSQFLVTTPDLEGLPSLERLILECCWNLERIDGSYKDMMRLFFVDIRDCKNIGWIRAVAERKERKKKKRREKKKKKRRREKRENEKKERTREEQPATDSV